MSAKVIPLPDRTPRFFNAALTPEDEAILLERLRILASGAGLTLQDIHRLIPHAASIAIYRRIDMLYAIDLHFICAWLEDNPKPPLEELQLISEILSKWDANHLRCNPFWSLAAPTPEEMEINERIVAVCQRLIAKGQYTE